MPVCSPFALEGWTKALGSDKPLLAVSSWACYLTSLSLYFLVWKRLTQNCRIQWDNAGKAGSTWKHSIINVSNFVTMMISWELARFLQIISPSRYPDGKTEVRRSKGTCSRSCSKLEDLGPRSLFLRPSLSPPHILIIFWDYLRNIQNIPTAMWVLQQDQFWDKIIVENRKPDQKAAHPFVGHSSSELAIVTHIWGTLNWEI